MLLRARNLETPWESSPFHTKVIPESPPSLSRNKLLGKLGEVMEILQALCLLGWSWLETPTCQLERRAPESTQQMARWGHYIWGFSSTVQPSPSQSNRIFTQRMAPWGHWFGGLLHGAITITIKQKGVKQKEFLHNGRHGGDKTHWIGFMGEFCQASQSIQIERQHQHLT